MNIAGNNNLMIHDLLIQVKKVATQQNSLLIFYNCILARICFTMEVFAGKSLQTPHKKAR